MRNPDFSDEFLVRHGSAQFSKIIMTESAFLTDEAWKKLVPFLIQGLRHVVREAAAKYGIDAKTADKLLIVLTFDGFKSHLKNLEELVEFADNNILCANEGRDSSEINQVGLIICYYYYKIMCCKLKSVLLQAFDRFVAKAGKKKAAQT